MGRFGAREGAGPLSSADVKPPESSPLVCFLLPVSTVSTCFCCFSCSSVPRCPLFLSSLRLRILQIALVGFGEWPGGETGENIAGSACCRWPATETSRASSDSGRPVVAWAERRSQSAWCRQLPFLPPFCCGGRALTQWSIRGWRGTKPADDLGSKSVQRGGPIGVGDGDFCMWREL